MARFWGWRGWFMRRAIRNFGRGRFGWIPTATPSTHTAAASCTTRASITGTARSKKAGLICLTATKAGTEGGVELVGVSCYSSPDLYHWKNEGNVLPSVKDDPSSDLHTSKVLERPKVIFNPRTRQFVMWMHIDSMDYSAARSGVAVSDNRPGHFDTSGVSVQTRGSGRTISSESDKHEPPASRWRAILRAARWPGI